MIKRTKKKKNKNLVNLNKEYEKRVILIKGELGVIITGMYDSHKKGKYLI